MADRYETWIRHFEEKTLLEVHLVGGESLSKETQLSFAVMGRCASATAAMVAEFPELLRVRGHYQNHPHWWCKTSDGRVVDPTAAQFYPGGTYVEYHGPDPYGKCMNCGEYVWTKDFSGMCSKECLDEISAEYGA